MQVDGMFQFLLVLELAIVFSNGNVITQKQKPRNQLPEIRMHRYNQLFAYVTLTQNI